MPFSKDSLLCPGRVGVVFGLVICLFFSFLMKFKHRQIGNGKVKFVFRTTQLIRYGGWKWCTKWYLGKVKGT